MTTKTRNVQVVIEENLDTTEADAVLAVEGKAEVRGHGSSRRHPRDAAVPLIGEELATARALSDLAHRLLDAAARDIEASTHTPAQPHL
ncbi:MAG: DUF1876 domain-containing protein [Actinomycetota bacterium]|nr:DUF1876 domain-containing protein [Actinomycetota bacterium]